MRANLKRCSERADCAPVPIRASLAARHDAQLPAKTSASRGRYLLRYGLAQQRGVAAGS